MNIELTRYDYYDIINIFCCAESYIDHLDDITNSKEDHINYAKMRCRIYLLKEKFMQEYFYQNK